MKRLNVIKMKDKFVNKIIIDENLKFTILTLFSIIIFECEKLVNLIHPFILCILCILTILIFKD